MRRFLPTNDAPNDIVMPERKTEKSAGYDICTPDKIVIGPHRFVMIKTFIKCRVGKGEYIEIVPRSSLFKKHKLIMVNSIGVIDGDYADNKDNDGNIGALLFNLSDKKQTLKKHEAFVQAIIHKYYVTDDDRAKGERVGGFGSTDQKGNDK